MVRDENQAFGGEHTVMCTHVGLWCCTPKTYML